MDATELWDHPATTIPNFNFCTQPWDAAAAVYWGASGGIPIQPDTTISANGSATGGVDANAKTFLTYFGKQHASINFDFPWAAAVDGPFSLPYNSTASFAVSGFVQNLSPGSLSNVTGVISLPPGLALASGDTAQKITTTLGSGAETSFNWNVVPTGKASGTLTYAVSFSAGPGTQGKVVTRTIDVPALPSQDFGTGLQMVSFPYNFSDPTPTTVFGLQQTDFNLLQWNPTISEYVVVSRIVPGQGYWLSLTSAKHINLQGGTPLPLGGTTNFEIPLQNGWNQIGNPFTLPVRWGDVQVITTDASNPNYLNPLTIDQASQAGLILPTIYSYDTTTGSYQFDQNFETNLVPLQGYWVKALVPNLSLLVPPPSNRSANLSSRAVQAKTQTSANNWSVRLVASNGKTQDAYNYVGVANGASDSYDSRDVEKPPAIQGSVRVGIIRDSWGKRSATYAQDIQAANGGVKTWNVLVTSPAANQDATLSWPEIASVPRGYDLYITDKTTGQRQLMRQISSLRFNTGATASRAFIITAQPRTGGSALLLRAQVHTGVRSVNSGVSIDVDATQEATLSIRVRSGGRIVRTLNTGRAASPGNTATVLWDYRDNKGMSVPSGLYVIEVVGTATDGRSSRTVVPWTVVR